MNADELRKIENFVLSQPLAKVNDPDNLEFLAHLIEDHDHLREKLMTEPDKRKRNAKLEKMRPFLKFKAVSLNQYELAEAARACGVQPIYEEEKKLEESRIWMPTSHIHEVRG